MRSNLASVVPGAPGAHSDKRFGCEKVLSFRKPPAHTHLVRPALRQQVQYAFHQGTRQGLSEVRTWAEWESCIEVRSPPDRFKAECRGRSPLPSQSPEGRTSAPLVGGAGVLPSIRACPGAEGPHKRPLTSKKVPAAVSCGRHRAGAFKPRSVPEFWRSPPSPPQ